MIDGVMPDPEIRVRSASADDVAAIYRLAAAHDVHLEGPDGLGTPYLDRLFSDGTVLVAERRGTVVGFAAAARLRPAAGSAVPGRSHVSDLFVEPSEHGSGVGGPLFRALLEAHVDERWSVSSSGDPRAQALYARAGMIPSWPLFYLQRPRAAAGRPLPPPPGAVIRRVTVPELVAAFAALSGLDRTLDIRTWSSRRGGTPISVELDGRLALAGCVRDGATGFVRWLDAAVIAPDADPVAALVAALASDDIARPDGSIGLCLGGPHPALRPLLDAGFRIVERDTWGESTIGLVDPARIVPDPNVG
jgi:GNAT superfamily N-acetyltransferase